MQRKWCLNEVRSLFVHFQVFSIAIAQWRVFQCIPRVSLCTLCSFIKHLNISNTPVQLSWDSSIPSVQTICDCTSSCRDIVKKGIFVMYPWKFYPKLWLWCFFKTSGNWVNFWKKVDTIWLLKESPTKNWTKRSRQFVEFWYSGRNGKKLFSI